MSDFYKNEKFEINQPAAQSKGSQNTKKGILGKIVFGLFQVIKFLVVFIFEFILGALSTKAPTQNMYDSNDPGNPRNFKS